MNEAALRDEGRLRDVERWKDKIEVRLDNRQVFFLFFGSAVVACMLFVLGVIVGKRIESRGRAEAADVQDPLAALDRAHQPPFVAGPVAPPAELLFPKALQAGAAKGARAEKGDKASIVPTPAVPPVARVVTPPAPKLVAAAPKPVAAKPVAPKPAPAVDAAKVKGKYTLQLSAFPTREEADAFAAKYDGTFVLPTDLPGKGTWYRVRCGNFASFQEATAAKLAFEKQNKVIALVSAR
ncbi:MAG TPA: SPOR domain-containing protein [Polyangia bacterium]|nr:SPOR domain-containing protein [Polyangia bacterium]